MGLISLAARLGGAALRKPGVTWQAIDNIGSIAGLGYLGTQLPGMSGRTNKELARDFDIKDIDDAYDSLGFHQKLPFIGATKEGLEKQIRKQETREIEASAPYLNAAAELDADDLPDITGMSKTQARTALGTATRRVREEREIEKQKRDFYSPKQEYERYQRELLRTDAINARADERIHNMEMYRMGLEQQDRRDRRDARMQLVAALTGSLGNLGDAFLSI